MVLVLLAAWLLAGGEVEEAIAVGAGAPDAGAPSRRPRVVGPALQVTQSSARTDAPGAISGWVQDSATKEGIAGAVVTFESGGAHDVVSEPDGSFVFRPPRAGTYLLTAIRASGFGPYESTRGLA